MYVVCFFVHYSTDFDSWLTFGKTLGHTPRYWHLIDAKGYVVGRLATQVTPLLLGKYKPYYHPAFDQCGDFVVVLNAEKLVFTGNKWDNHIYRWHTGWPGGLKEVPAKMMLQKNPQYILEHAVRGMLPNNKLRSRRLSRLKVVIGPENPYEGKVKFLPKEVTQKLIAAPTRTERTTEMTLKDGFLIELEDAPDMWRIYASYISPDPAMAKSQLQVYIEDYVRRFPDQKKEVMERLDHALKVLDRCIAAGEPQQNNKKQK
jgi:large subunit ribosomal protein L13